MSSLFNLGKSILSRDCIYTKFLSFHLLQSLNSFLKYPPNIFLLFLKKLNAFKSPFLDLLTSSMAARDLIPSDGSKRGKVRFFQMGASGGEEGRPGRLWRGMTHMPMKSLEVITSWSKKLRRRMEPLMDELSAGAGLRMYLCAYV